MVDQGVAERGVMLEFPSLPVRPYPQAHVAPTRYDSLYFAFASVLGSDNG